MSYSADGQLKTLTAKNSDTGDQVTTWVYGIALSDSDIARSDVLRGKEDPEKSRASRSSSDFDWETLFHAYRYDTETGLCQVRNRYLHPNLGRWVNGNPIGARGGLSLYAFVGNGPVIALDSMGQFGEFIDCCPCQEKALEQDLERAKKQMFLLGILLDDAIVRMRAEGYDEGRTRPGPRSRGGGRRRARTIIDDLNSARSIVRRASKKLDTMKVRCRNQNGPIAMVWPFGNTISVYEPYWRITDEAQAASLVHEATHGCCGATDAAYFWQNARSPDNTLFFRFPHIASTYDTWLIAGFCVPGYDSPESVNVDVRRGAKQC